jgi:hypothetical protein
VQDKIIECTERVRGTLAERGEINILSLAEILGERSVVVYQALGWMAREGGIVYHRQANRVFVSLAAKKEGEP